MYEAIKNFHTQFQFEPLIENEAAFSRKPGFVVVGMGGSALAPKILKTWKPGLDIYIHSDYGVPGLQNIEEKLIILSSYSGNTEEVLEAFAEAKGKNLPMAIIAAGGRLLALAKENGVPYIELPNTDIQPRMALGYSVKAFLKLLGEENALKETSGLAETLKPEELEAEGKTLAERMKNFVPIIYSSNQNFAVAYNWKIKLNETGKIPAFYNTLPELNHNEMTGFDVKDSSKLLSDKFRFIILKDSVDHPKIQKRMEVLEKIYSERGLGVEVIELKGANFWQKTFSCLILADWFAYYTAELYGLEPEQVPMVEEFKKLIS